MGDLDDLEPEAAREACWTTWRTCGLVASVITTLRAAGRLLRDQAGVGGDGGAVVAGGVRDVHPGQLADRGLVLEDRLQDPLGELGLVGGVGGQELAALQHRIDHRGHVVVVDAGAEEGDLVDHVLRRELLEVAGQLGLGEGGRHVERAPEADRGGDVAE